MIYVKYDVEIDVAGEQNPKAIPSEIFWLLKEAFITDYFQGKMKVIKCLATRHFYELPNFLYNK